MAGDSRNDQERIKARPYRKGKTGLSVIETVWMNAINGYKSISGNSDMPPEENHSGDSSAGNTSASE